MQAQAAGDAMALFATLTTIDADGWPMSRTVTLRSIDGESICLSVNLASPKCGQLQANRRYELLIFWPSAMAQYRLRGDYALEAVGDSDWQRKPAHSCLADLYHSNHRAQSSVLPSREAMLAEAAGLRLDDASLQPADVATLRLIPTEAESWLASPADRLHHRARHRLTSQGWQAELLVP